jgi:hypothetical protein
MISPRHGGESPARINVLRRGGLGRLPERNHSNFTTYNDLKKWIKAYVINGKLDRHAGDVVLKLMDELEAGSSVVRVIEP